MLKNKRIPALAILVALATTGCAALKDAAKQTADNAVNAANQAINDHELAIVKKGKTPVIVRDVKWVQTDESYKICFGFDSAELNEAASEEVERLAAWLQANEGIQVLLVGHADAAGPEKYNEGLALRRALAVRDRLLSLGIKWPRLSFYSMGETQPLGGSVADDRRVEIRAAHKTFVETREERDDG